MLSILGGSGQQRKTLFRTAYPFFSSFFFGLLGSGKTTLLNSIAGRLGDVMKVSGKITFESSSERVKNTRSLMGYVMQNDYLLPNLTVEETLRFSALLRLPDSMTRGEKLDMVDHVIAVLGLRDCRTTYIGGNGRRGVSGGEKRRVSIACQMLTSPSKTISASFFPLTQMCFLVVLGILLLDEPTSMGFGFVC
jgi:ABC-type multidrug transport system ATPase subunit